MTEEQEKQFEIYGCASRCLLALAHLSGNPITVTQYLDRYSLKYPHWKERNEWGGTETSDVLDIARELNLAQHFQIYINPNEVRRRIKKLKFVLLFTEKRENKNGLSDNFHCSLVDMRQSGDGYFAVCQVENDIKVAPHQIWLEGQIREIGGYFGAFY